MQVPGVLGARSAPFNLFPSTEFILSLAEGLRTGALFERLKRLERVEPSMSVFSAHDHPAPAPKVSPG